MPKVVNPIRKRKLKEGILQGKDATQCLLDAGYAKTTASLSTAVVGYRQALEELKRLGKISPLTEDDVHELIEYVQARAVEKGDLSILTKLVELKGKILAMFTDKSQVTASITHTEQEREELTGIRSRLKDAGLLSS